MRGAELEVASSEQRGGSGVAAEVADFVVVTVSLE